MFDFAWSEVILLLIIALVFLGPKELIILLKTLGRFFGKIKQYQRYFQEQLDMASKATETMNHKGNHEK